jgi:hypothetical protein
LLVFILKKKAKMAMKAVGWLSNNLGWNISGRSQAPPDAPSEGQPHQQPAETQPVGSPTQLERYMSNVSSVVFGGSGQQQAQSSNPFANIGGSNEQQQQKVDEVDNAELDEQGLPKTRNWYYYDEALQRWNVHPNAPASVKAEYAERLRQEEEEKNKAMRFPEPPPPPPPSFNPAAMQARTPLVPQYAIPTYFNEKQD